MTTENQAKEDRDGMIAANKHAARSEALLKTCKAMLKRLLFVIVYIVLSVPTTVIFLAGCMISLPFIIIRWIVVGEFDDEDFTFWWLSWTIGLAWRIFGYYD